MHCYSEAILTTRTMLQTLLRFNKSMLHVQPRKIQTRRSQGCIYHKEEVLINDDNKCFV
jgi:hypothetical protein